MTFAGVVPAAGSSRRMGRAKGLLRIGGESFLHRVVRALVDGGCDPVYVVVAEGDEVMEDEARGAGGQPLRNPDPGEGPITSLRIALREIGASRSGIAYLPLDHPLVPATVVSELLRVAESDGAPLTLPVVGRKRGHPAIFGRALFPELLDPALEGGARMVVHRHLHEARLVQTRERGVVIDIDTPRAYAAALERFAEESEA